EAAYNPPAVERQSPFGRWSISCSLSDGKLTFIRKFAIKARWVAREDYSGFKEFCEEYGLPKHTLLLLEKKKK
ncbi:MAG: hypothetical protein U9P14_10105, partial [Gemmatimonadota bacterium]|nr:hypothetical protein [Gemmatimonadota bacterium]